MAGDEPGVQPVRPTGADLYTPIPTAAAARAAALSAQASVDYAAGEKAGSNSDEYVRTTVFLATVLFLAGIGSHLEYGAIRYGLAGVACAILLFAIALLATAPKPSF